jgi:uncharacterized protein YjiS (DUF1127 family)
MSSETEWPGYNVAAPVCDTYDWEGALLDNLGGSWNRIGTRWDGVDPVATELAPRDWRGTTIAAPTNCGGWRRWVGSIAATVAGLWSRVLHEREIRRIRAAWRTIDDRTLEDIGISRIEFEYAQDPRPWS